MMKQTIDKKTVLSSMAWKVLERIFSQGVNLVVQIVLARLLLPEDFGSLALIVAIVNYASIFVQSGLATAIIQKEDLDELDVSTLLSGSLIVATLFYIIIFVSSPYIATYYNIPELSLALRVLSIVLFLYALNSIQTAILSRRMKFKTLFFRSVLAVPISGAVGIILAYFGYGIWALVIHYLINSFIVVVVMSFGLDTHLSLKFSLIRAKKLYAFSGKILITSLIAGGHDFIRTMIIGKKYTSDDLAYYDKAYTYSNYITQIANQSISSVLLPAFSRKQNDLNELHGMARRSVSLSSFVMFPVLLGACAASRQFILALLSSKWEQSIPFLMVFCILRIPGVVTSVDKQVYYAIGKSGINLAYESVFCTINILILIISSKLGVFQIAVGATIVEVLGGIAISFISRKIYRYTIKERIADLFKPAANSLIMAIIVYQLNRIEINSLALLFIQAIVGIIVYVLLAKITKDNNFDYMFSILKNIRRKNRD